MRNQTSPLILSFGMFDPAGAIGLGADAAAFAACGCHGLLVPTAHLVADTARIEEVQAVEPDWLVDQARVLLEDMPVAAFKLGAMASTEQVSAIAEILADYPDVPLVLDPFLSMLAEGSLGDDMLEAVRQVLIPQSSVLLVAGSELERLAEAWREAGAEDAMAADAARLIGSGCAFVLVSHGDSHGSGEQRAVWDTLFDIDGEIETFSRPRLAGQFTGAGGTLSAALAAYMACGLEAPDAVEAAEDYLAGALANAQRLGMGKLVPNRFFRNLTQDS